MHISYESGELEDPNCPPQDKMFKKTANIVDCPDTPANLSIDFEKGIPVSVNNLLHKLPSNLNFTRYITASVLYSLPPSSSNRR